MNFLQSTTRALSISLEGLKEAIMGVAERVARRVHVAKLRFQAEDAEVRLRQAYESLGQCLYATHTVRFPETLTVIDEALPMCESIRAEQRTLEAVRDRLASQYEEVLTVPLIRLHEDLQAGGGTVEHVTIAPGIAADGRRLADLSLPESVGIVLVRRGESVLFPHAEVVLRAGDQVTLIGRRSAMPAALQSLRA
ncbi:MAG TPA: TrkA C-terminal domain-containing protein [Nitrospirales bacterium]|nr:TrkA C-terminal domain-containing protein [Nitrospirales bacterium]